MDIIIYYKYYILYDILQIYMTGENKAETKTIKDI